MGAVFDPGRSLLLVDFCILHGGTFRVDKEAPDFPVESILRFLVQIVMQRCEEIG